MAYLDLSQTFSSAAASPVAAPQDFVPAAEAAGFERTEWAVIALAAQDGLETLHETRQSKLGRLLMGRARSYTLTAGRLEALRRLAVEAWHRPLAISVTALGGFMAEGFSNPQLALLLATTGALRAISRQIGATRDGVGTAESSQAGDLLSFAAPDAA